MQLGFQRFVLGRLGRHADAQQIAAALQQIAKSRFVPPCAFALVYVRLGDGDSTFAWLDRACELRDIFLVFLPCGKGWESVRADMRFAALLRR